MPLQRTINRLKQVSVTECSSVFSFEWKIEHYYPDTYLSCDFCHPLFPDDLWFIRFDPPSSAWIESHATITIIPKNAVSSKIAITFEWNDQIILRTIFNPSSQALSAQHNVQDGYETLIGKSICLRCNLLYPSKLNKDIIVAKTLEHDLKDILEDLNKVNSTADFKLISSDGVNFVKAHRLILAARSPYFAAMFSMDSEEKNCGSVNLKLTPIKLLEKIVSLIYERPIDLDTLDVVEEAELFKFADQYDFSHIKLMLECHLASRLSLESVPLVKELVSHIDSDILSRAVERVETFSP